MSEYLKKTLDEFRRDVSDFIDVNDVLNQMIESIEKHHVITAMKQLNIEHENLKSYIKTLLIRYKTIKIDKDKQENAYNQLKIRSESMRDVVVHQIGTVLRQSKRIDFYENKIHNLQMNLSDKEEELTLLKQSQSVIEQPTVTISEDKLPVPVSIVYVHPTNPRISILHKLKGDLLLRSFSFLETIDILSAAQVCKYVYASVYKVFGLDSATISASWSIEPKITPNESNKDLNQSRNTAKSIIDSPNGVTSPVKSFSIFPTPSSNATPTIPNMGSNTSNMGSNVPSLVKNGSVSSTSFSSVNIFQSVESLTKKLTGESYMLAPRQFKI
jgi:hypothetical protein